MSTLEHALVLAARAHENQEKRGIEPFILHVLRVVLSVDDEARTAAALHDLVEKTHWTLEGLRMEGFSDEVVETVDALTRREDETREEFVRRAAAHPVARRIKQADLEDNEAVTRRAPDTPDNREKLARYARERQVLEEADADGEDA